MKAHSAAANAKDNVLRRGPDHVRRVKKDVTEPSPSDNANKRVEHQIRQVHAGWDDLRGACLSRWKPVLARFCDPCRIEVGENKADHIGHTIPFDRKGADLNRVFADPSGEQNRANDGQSAGHEVALTDRS